MDTTSTTTRKSHTASELEKFALYYEMLAPEKPSGRAKTSHASSK